MPIISAVMNPFITIGARGYCVDKIFIVIKTAYIEASSSDYVGYSLDNIAPNRTHCSYVDVVSKIDLIQVRFVQRIFSVVYAIFYTELQEIIFDI